MRCFALDHAFDRVRIERPPILVDMACLLQRGADPAQGHALASLGARPMQTLGQGHGCGVHLAMVLAALTLAAFLADAIAGSLELGDEPRLLVFGESAGDLAHHLTARIIEALVGDDWDRAARILASCRDERKRCRRPR